MSVRPDELTLLAVDGTVTAEPLREPHDVTKPMAPLTIQ